MKKNIHQCIRSYSRTRRLMTITMSSWNIPCYAYSWNYTEIFGEK
jgi:hypothetical protein